METEKSRSESPFSRSKNKSHLSDAPEIGNAVIEQIKTKKKNLRNKSKSHSNGKENEEVTKNGKENEEVTKNGKENEEVAKNGKENEEVAKIGKENEEVGKNGKENEEVAKIGKENEETEKIGKYFSEEEKLPQIESERNLDPNSPDHENGIENGQSPENSKEKDEAPKEKDALISNCEIPEEKITNASISLIIENSAAEECKSAENITTASYEENSTEHCSKLETTETESSVKKNNSSGSNLMLEYEIVSETSGQTCSENENGILNKEINVTVKEMETSENCLESEKSVQTDNRKSDVSLHYEEDNANHHIQESPDTATKDGLSVSIKITSFLENWRYSQEQKQDSEVSSSKKIENTFINQFDLSKVSGRRGIKDRLNSSAAVFSSKEMEAKTPESSQISLDDSFRVRTNPSRLNSLHLKENPTLRKFKGKRCLNAEDEPEEDDIYVNSMKKIKLDEKTQNSGLLGSIFWSPFKKKSYEDKNQLKPATAESKLSRLLSPFWFWKKTGTEHEHK